MYHCLWWLLWQTRSIWTICNYSFYSVITLNCFIPITKKLRTLLLIYHFQITQISVDLLKYLKNFFLKFNPTSKVYPRTGTITEFMILFVTCLNKTFKVSTKSGAAVLLKFAVTALPISIFRFNCISLPSYFLNVCPKLFDVSKKFRFF